MNKKLRIIDTTLRDGSHALAHQYSLDDVAAISQALAAAGSDTMEVGHGDGLGGSSYQYGLGKCNELDIIRTAAENAGDTKVGVLLIPGIGTMYELEPVLDLGVRLVRVATHVTEADVGEQHIAYAKRRGIEAMGFLMMAHMAGPEKILEQARLFESYGADAIYMADSAGALLPDGVKQRVDILKKNIKLPIGFHAHNNLGLAIGNSLAAIDAGADYIDTTLRGLGAGAGNAPHEILVAVLKKMGYPCDEDLYKLMDAAEDIVRPLGVNMMVDKLALTLGYAGVYGSFYLHAKRAADFYGLDARDILMELGRLKTVGGQEDMILDVANKLKNGG